MSKYTKYINNNIQNNSPLIDGETELWSGKPKKSAFIVNKIFSALPFVLVWFLMDGMIGFFIISDTAQVKILWLFIIPFFVLHLLPVWLWFGNILTVNRKWKNAKYYMTNKRIIIQNGYISENYQTIYYKDISNVTLHVGLIDKMLGVGDVIFSVNQNDSSEDTVFFDLENYKEIYNKIQKIVLDMQTDIEYPNAYRPETNPGYNTKYDSEK